MFFCKKRKRDEDLKTEEKIKTIDREEELKQIGKFIKSVFETVQEPGKNYEWECPVCGGKATGYMVESNGHIHARCAGCGSMLMQ